METRQNIRPIIEASLASMTDIEKMIAHHFLTGYPSDVSPESLTQHLHLSRASLTRFAQKCGFKGYREFVYEYQRLQSEQEQTYASLHHNLTKQVLADYDEILSKTYNLVEESQLMQVSKWIEEAERVYFYGLGSSGLVANELKIRFMRLGLICEAVTDPHMLHWMDNLVNQHCLVIGLSVSGETIEVLSALEKAHSAGARTVLMTTQKMDKKIGDEHILVASSLHLSYGNRISPQFPLLVIADLLYAYFMNKNKASKEEKFNRTIIHNY